MKLVTVGRIVSAVVSIVFFASCLNDESKDALPDNTKETIIIVDLPEQTEIETRQVGSKVENKLQSFAVFAFNPNTGTLVSRSQGTVIGVAPGFTASENKWRVSVQLPAGSYNFMAVVNVPWTELEGIVSGTEQVIVRQLERNVAAGTWPLVSNNVTPMPMWGLLKNKTTPLQNGTLEFKMTRMLAKVEVDATGVSNFTLTSVRYYNYTTRGFLVPDYSKAGICEIAADGTATIKAPTDYNQPLGKRVGDSEFILYSGSHISGGKSCLNSIYVFEAPHVDSFPAEAQWDSKKEWIENPCLVIGGKYAGSSSETFYRVDFIEKKTGQKDVWHSILRNNVYKVSINKVSGPGYEGSDGYKTAYKSAPMNMDVSIYVNKESDKSGLATDGPYHLSVSDNEFVIARSKAPGTGFPITVKTNYPHGWKAEIFGDAAGTTKLMGVNIDQTINVDSWLSLSGTTSESTATAGSNMTANLIGGKQVGTAYVKITAGRMSVVVKVMCSIAPDFARSHVVLAMDDNGQYLNFSQNGVSTGRKDRSLTFAVTETDNVNIPSNVQGLNFRFGSLLAIASTGSHHDDKFNSTDFTSDKVVFLPPDVTDKTWTWGVSSGNDTSDNIPYCNGDDSKKADYFDPNHWSSWKDKTKRYQVESNGKVTKGIGDICAYISDQGWVQGKWRMPTAAEVTMLLWTETATKTDGNKRAGVTLGNFSMVTIPSDAKGKAGRTEITSGLWLGTAADSGPMDLYDAQIPPFGTAFFPAGGYRKSPEGTSSNPPISKYGGQFREPGKLVTTWSASSNTRDFEPVHNNYKAYCITNYTTNSFYGALKSENPSSSWVRGDAMPVRCLKISD